MNDIWFCQNRQASTYVFLLFFNRDSDGTHSYITRTDAKTEFLLKDEDFDKREPALRYLTRPNPHNSRWGDMKLYLRLQVSCPNNYRLHSLLNVTYKCAAVQYLSTQHQVDCEC